MHLYYAEELARGYLHLLADLFEGGEVDYVAWNWLVELRGDLVVDFYGLEFGEGTQTGEVVDVPHVVECVIGVLDGDLDGLGFGEVEIEYGVVETGTVPAAMEGR